MRTSFKSAKLQSLQQWAKIIVVNLMVFLFLLIAAEILLRSIWTVRSCIESECDFSRIAGLKVRTIDRATDIGLTRLDELLGYVPREGFSATINAAGWVNGKVTIRKDGFRSNGAEPPLPADVLVVGDSYTFGDHVSDNETWPACLERKLGRGVDNGGVMGYGTAQALRRASLKLAEKSYATLVLSTVVGSDFERDRLSYRGGFPKPAVIHTKNGIAWSAVPDPNTPGTKFNPLHHEALSFVYERSEILAVMLDRFFPNNNIVGDRLTIVHQNAADENEIVYWTLRKFSKLEIKNKILLLQYGNVDTEKRKLILRIANELSLKVIDTSDVLRNAKKNELWYYGHHTPFGNELVCSYLFEHGFQ
ncbi:MAG TPA: hypothetical protein VGZ89_17755 [Xanthobacteraceae bacterium]|jgi:hypothetical protein|nr:hypothetical protein [Xanthobacteraceae bacterium]